MFNNIDTYTKRLIYFGTTVSVIILCLFLFKTHNFKYEEDIKTEVWGHYGDVIGGVVGTIFSLVGIILLFETLRLQRQQNNEQKEQFITQQKLTDKFFLKEQISTIFYEMLKIQRDNSREITVGEKIGRKVFIQMERELNLCFEQVSKYKNEYGVNMDLDKTINLSYLIFYYGGVGEKSKRIIKKITNGTYADGFIDFLLGKIENSQSNLKKEEKFDWKPFEGHQLRLGHYYRHLFQTVKYINDISKNVLSFEEKYQYIKNLRAQLSTQEQVLFLWNSLSTLGMEWEKNALDFNHQLISKYNLIKNIPFGHIDAFDPAIYYPNVDYENSLKIQEKRPLYE